MEKDLAEIRDRMRRVETKLTRYMEAQGFDTKCKHCILDEDNETVEIPNIKVSLDEVLNVLGDGEDYAIVYKGKTLGYISKLDAAVEFG